jgi:hypothetical protein
MLTNNDFTSGSGAIDSALRLNPSDSTALIADAIRKEIEYKSTDNTNHSIENAKEASVTAAMKARPKSILVNYWKYGIGFGGGIYRNMTEATDNLGDTMDELGVTKSKNQLMAKFDQDFGQ